MLIGWNSPKFGIIFATGTLIGRARVTMAARFRSCWAVLKERGNCNLGPRQGAEIEAICKHELAIWRAWRCAWASHNLLLDSWLHLLFSLATFIVRSNMCHSRFLTNHYAYAMRSHHVSGKKFSLSSTETISWEIDAAPRFFISSFAQVLRFKINRIESKCKKLDKNLRNFIWRAKAKKKDPKVKKK